MMEHLVDPDAVVTTAVVPDSAAGMIFDVQRYCTHDGPGIRTTVFFKGCPLGCRWCHNPESISSAPEIVFRKGRCIACDACRCACPQRRLDSDPDSGTRPCTLCGSCVDACPTGARELAGRRVTVAQLLAEILADRIFFDDSGGGVTFSGGEPLAQPGLFLGCLAACKEHELHTAVDTSGAGSRTVLLEAARLTDLFLFDLKLIDPQRHRQFTGAGNEEILANLQALGRCHSAVWLRVPVIPGCNDDSENIAAIAGIAAATPAVQRICLLPYHRAGEAKRSRLQSRIVCGNGDATWAPPSHRHLQELARVLGASGVPVSIGG